MAKILIRKARATDTSNLIRLLEDGHEDDASAYPGAVDQVRGLRWITETLCDGHVIVADLSGRLVGSLALTNYQFPWSAQWYMYLEWLFVHKRFRAMGAFDAMMAAAHAYADEHGAPILAGVSASGKDVFVKDRLMQMRGYTYIGGDFIRSAANGREKEDNQAGV